MIGHGWRYHVCLLLVSLVLASCRSAAPTDALSVASPATLSPAAVVPQQPNASGAATVGRETAEPLDAARPLSPAIRLANYQDTIAQDTIAQDTNQELPQPDMLAGEAPAETLPGPATIQLEDVIRSIQASYPLLVSALEERTVASGKLLATRGGFDLNTKMYSIAAPEGFYANYQNGVALEQPLFQGGYLYGGYKIGDGKFQPWFKERETNEGGEFSIGWGTPLLKGRAIDQRRADLFQAELGLRAVEPGVQTQLLEFVRAGTQTYWKWVAAGQAVVAQRELLRNAQQRVAQIETRVQAGDLALITRLNNQQLIADREAKLIETDRKLQEAAIKLSLFYRDGGGRPLVASDSQLPADFPQVEAPDDDRLSQDIARAIDASPLLAELNLVIAQVEVELRNAENSLLPKLDARTLASKDMGAAASPARDKDRFELEAGLYGELPLQRREAQGKIRAAQGKLAQLNAKRQFVLDKTVAAVQDAISALRAAAGQIDRAALNLRLARETLRLGRVEFEAGDIDLISLNIYEKAVTDAQLQLITASETYFDAMADYRAALAVDPLAAQ